MIFSTDVEKRKLSTINIPFLKVVAVIVFLNLLIALMNSTVQKVHDQKELYWKFTRTSIWVEFFDDTAMLPPPFTMLNVFWSLPHAVYSLARRLVSSAGGRLLGKAEREETACREEWHSFGRRMAHARLMVRLIERVLLSGNSSREQQGERMKKDLI